MILRPYQHAIINETRQNMKCGIRSVLIVAPTGSGKTVLTAHMLKTAASKGFQSLFLNHRRELIKQSSETFSQVGVAHGIIANGFPSDHKQMIQIASIQTIARRLNKIQKPRFVIWDECQHCPAEGWRKVHEQFKDAFHVGLTATPERLDGRGLKDHFQVIVSGPSVRSLIDAGFLSDYKIYAPSTINTQGLHTLMGDFVKSELLNLVDKPSITGDVVKHYRKLADGKRAVVFCVSIEHSKRVRDQFIQEGISAAHVDGETSMEVRDAEIKRFRQGETKVLCNVDLFGEGFDLPSLEVAILLRPTQSLSLYLQQVGRALRSSPGKLNAVVLDHSGNVMRHGLPDDDREWSLDGMAGRKAENGAKTSVRVCPVCFAAQRSGAPVCLFCGHTFKVEARKITSRQGDLEEIDTEKFRKVRRVEQGRTTTLQDLIELGRKRGYKRPEMWAGFIHRARQARKIMGAQ